MPIKKVAKKKYVNMEVWTIASVDGMNDGGSKFFVTLNGRSKNCVQDFQIILKMDYYSLSVINEKVKNIIQRRVDFQTANLKNILK